jgi:hypothetical protein
MIATTTNSSISVKPIDERDVFQRSFHGQTSPDVYPDLVSNLEDSHFKRYFFTKTIATSRAMPVPKRFWTVDGSLKSQQRTYSLVLSTIHQSELAKDLGFTSGSSWEFPQTNFIEKWPC